jgi:hypothetical protein
MALSDQLNSLAARAKDAEDHAAAAKQEAKDDLRRDAVLNAIVARRAADALAST